MRNSSKILIVAMLVLGMIVSVAFGAEAMNENEMKALLEEEMTAEYLYRELAKQYPENALFANIARSEANHIKALQRAATRLGLSVEGAKVQSIAIPATKEDAVKFAMAFELEDIEMLKTLIAKTEDAKTKRVLENLLKGSNKHYETLKKALEVGVDNMECNEQRAYGNKANNAGQLGKGQQGQGQGQGQQGRGQGQNRGNQRQQSAAGTCTNEGPGQAMRNMCGNGRGNSNGKGQFGGRQK